LAVFDIRVEKSPVILTNENQQGNAVASMDVHTEVSMESPDEEKSTMLEWRPVRLFREIWKEFTFGVGAWGTLRPLITALLASIPFLFLGQHFNRQHRKAFDWTLLQIPLALTIVLWIGLWAYSVFDAWREATKLIASQTG
tara:strand:- start:1453 stop:1875 length:423 start_codon:yes stop_codon:yes gene_type:complete